MEKTVGEVFLLFRLLGFKERDVLQHIQELLSEEQYRDTILLLKQKKMTAQLISLPLSPLLVPLTEKCAVFQPTCVDPEVTELVLDVNQQIQKHFFKQQWKQFAQDAPLKLPKLLVPSVLGFDLVKRALALQLFAIDPVHILFCGEPSIGKTSILRCVAAVHPSSCYCSAAALPAQGLLATELGDEIEHGPLPQADNGLLCIDDIHALPSEDVHSLVQAMEKGVVSYQKAEEPHHFAAHVRVLATTHALDALPATLLPQFHFVFSLKKPQSALLLKKEDMEKDKNKPSLNTIDLEFLKSYICYAEQLQVQLSDVYQEQLVSYISHLQKKQKLGMQDFSHLLLGMKQLAEARARMCLREKVIQEDITEVKTIVERSMNSLRQ